MRRSLTSSGEKAGTVGGLFGEVVYVSTADELEKQLNSVGAQTIVITADIDMRVMDIEVVEGDEASVHYECNKERYEPEINVEKGVLYIKQKKNKKSDHYGNVKCKMMLVVPENTNFKKFTISNNTGDVKITVKLAGSIVRFAFTENFVNYYSDYTFTLTTGNNTVISVPKDETRAVFMDAYQFKVKGELTNQAGKVQSFSEKEFKNLAPATCYTLKFDASNVGGSSITISFDDTVVDADLIDVDLND